MARRAWISTLDAGKRDALTEALATSGALRAAGGRALDESRGEPAFVFELGGQTLALVVEGLGTESIIARQMEPEIGPVGFRHVAYDSVAAIVNDLCCVGALPLVVNAYFATGSSDWYAHHERHAALLRGCVRRATTPAPPGAAGSRLRCRAWSTRTRSSWLGAPSARCRQTASRSSAPSLRRAMTSCRGQQRASRQRLIACAPHRRPTA